MTTNALKEIELKLAPYKFAKFEKNNKNKQTLQQQAWNKGIQTIRHHQSPWKLEN